MSHCRLDDKSFLIRSNRKKIYGNSDFVINFNVMMINVPKVSSKSCRKYACFHVMRIGK